MFGWPLQPRAPWRLADFAAIRQWWGLERALRIGQRGRPRYELEGQILARYMAGESALHIADACGVHHNTVYRHLSAMAAEGKVQLRKKRTRRRSMTGEP